MYYAPPQILQATARLRLQEWEYRLEASCIEVYNNNMRDLLSPGGREITDMNAIKHDAAGGGACIRHVYVCTCVHVYTCMHVSACASLCACMCAAQGERTMWQWQGHANEGEAWGGPVMAVVYPPPWQTTHAHPLGHCQ